MKTITKILAIGAIGFGILVGVGCNEAPRDSIESKVTRQIRRADSWVEDFVERDYLNGGEKPVQLRLSPIDMDKKNEKMGIMSNDGVYNLIDNILSINPNSVQSIHHELWHAFYDGNEVKGAFYSKKSSGPTQEEIKEYCSKKLKTELSSYKENIDLAIEQKLFREKIEYGKVHLAKISNLTSALSSSCENFSLKDIPTAKQVLKEIEKYNSDCREFKEWSVGWKNRTLSREVGLEEYRRDNRSLGQIIKNMDEETSSLRKYYGFLGIDSVIKLEDATTDCIALQRDIDVTRLNQALGEDEIMARMVGSLYNLYFGKGDTQQFQLNENDLIFLSKFKYNGKPTFQKGIDKYRIGLDMINRGFTIEKTRKKLIDSKSVRYKDKRYLWRENNFEIKGKIPLEIKR